MALNTRNLTIAVLATIIGLASVTDAEAGKFKFGFKIGGGNHGKHNFHWGHKYHSWRKHHHRKHYYHKHYVYKPYRYPKCHHWAYYNHYRGFCEPCHYHNYSFAPAPAPFVATQQATVPVQSVAAPAAPVEITTGTWTARPANNVKIVLSFGADSRFQWQQTMNGKNNAFVGSYSLENGVLTLTREDNQQTLIGNVTINNGGFNFKLQNGDANDPGLNFIR